MRSWVCFTSTAGWIGSSAVAAAAAGAVLNLWRRAPGNRQRSIEPKVSAGAWIANCWKVTQNPWTDETTSQRLISTCFKLVRWRMVGVWSIRKLVLYEIQAMEVWNMEKQCCIWNKRWVFNLQYFCEPPSDMEEPHLQSSLGGNFRLPLVPWLTDDVIVLETESESEVCLFSQRNFADRHAQPPAMPIAFYCYSYTNNKSWEWT